MLTIVVPGIEHYNEETQEFFTVGDVTLQLEHSLATLSKWESIHEKAFLAPGNRTPEETVSYIEVMIQSPDVPENIVTRFSEQNFKQVIEYIDSKQSATWFNESAPEKPSSEVITSELIYYWMVSFQIPFECEHWHLSRLFTLIRICNVKNSKPKKMSASEIAARNRQLNAERKAKYGTTG
jgi:hypothetical protein